MNRENGQGDAVVKDETHSPRFYRKVAGALMDDIRAGKYAIGGRMPAERDLATIMGVSRPIVREALLALEVMGIVEVRVGSGAYVLRLPDDDMPSSAMPDVSPIELIQARLIFEGEAAALAAINIHDAELETMAAAVEAMRHPDITFDEWQTALSRFYLTMAKATRNAAIERSVSDLWKMRSQSQECKRLLEEARTSNYRYSVEQHVEILAALTNHDARRARKAVRMHLEGSINHLLAAIEEQAVAEARQKVAQIRSRYVPGEERI